MAWKGFTGGVGNILPATFQAVYVMGTTAQKWQTLGAISNGVLNVEENQAPDSMARNRALKSYKFTASCRMMQSSLVELELLDRLCDGTNNFLFKTADAVTVSGVAAAGWIKVTASQVGIKGRLVADGTPEDNRYIELTWEGTVYKTDANEVALYTPTLAAADFGSSSTTSDFFTIGTYTAATDGGNPTPSQIRPCGISTVTIDAEGGSSADTVAPVMNVKFSVEMLSAQDSLRRHLPTSLDISLEFDCMASKNSDLLLLGNMSEALVKLVVTMIDSVAFTLNGTLGVTTNYEISGDMDKPRVIRFTHRGKTLQSNFDSIVA